MCKAHSMKLFQAEEVPEAVSQAIRRLQARHPEFQAHLKKRLAQWTGLSTSWTDKLINGQLSTLNAAHLLNAEQFFDYRLIAEILNQEIDEESRAAVLKHLQEIERITRRWTLS